jgi:hypothetical protein
MQVQKVNAIAAARVVRRDCPLNILQLPGLSEFYTMHKNEMVSRKSLVNE